MALRETHFILLTSCKEISSDHTALPTNSELSDDLGSPGYSPSLSGATEHLDNLYPLAEMPLPLWSVAPNSLSLGAPSDSLNDPNSNGFLGGTVSFSLSCTDVSYVFCCKKILKSCDTITPNPDDSRHSPHVGYFTVYIEHLNSGFSIPPPPTLVKLIKSLGISLSQLTPNALLYFFGFCHQVSVIHMEPSLEFFHSLFSARRTKPESDIYFQPRPKCRFLHIL